MNAARQFPYLRPSSLPLAAVHLRAKAFATCERPLLRRSFRQQSSGETTELWRRDGSWQSDPAVFLRILRPDIIGSMSMPKSQRPSIVFPGGGIYFWWQAGAVKALQESCDLDGYSFSGASAGSLSAVFAASGVDMDDAYQSAHRLASENGIWERREGLAGIWGSLIHQWLTELLPENVAERCSGRVSIMVTEVRPWFVPFERRQVCSVSRLILSLFLLCSAVLTGVV
jgi:hypothetical protein